MVQPGSAERTQRKRRRGQRERRRAHKTVCVGGTWLLALCAAALPLRTSVATAKPLTGPDAPTVSVLSYNVFGHPLFSWLQRPERFAKIAGALEQDFAQTLFVALQESHIPETEVLGRAAFHQLEGACGMASEFRPTGLRLFSRKKPRADVERYVFQKNHRGETAMLSESTLDCDSLRASRRTRKGFVAASFDVDNQVMLVVNLHFSPSKRTRQQERTLFLKWLREKPRAWSVTVVGDFNEDLCADPAIRQTWEQHALQAITCSVGSTVGGWRRGIWQGAFSGGQLDHILYRGAPASIDRRRVFQHPQNGLHWSDHDGVWGGWTPLPAFQDELRVGIAPKGD